MNSRIFHSPRSTEAPMDFQFTSRPNTTPAWKSDDDSSTPRKRPRDDMNPPTMDSTSSSSFGFGSNRNIPFIFATPSRQIPEAYSWAPPSASPARLFPPPSLNEIKDVDMPDASPPKLDEPNESTSNKDRAVATGALRRVYRARHKTLKGNRLVPTRSRDAGTDSDDDELEEEELNSWNQNRSHHYTLNVSPSSSLSDRPYILLGYLQFFFNLSLILVFLYLLLQFILTVQRDVEHRISEYSMDSVQEIARCALQYRNNYCDNPAMVAPALIHQCAEWELCMNRDPTKIGRARVGAELMAEVVNGFVEPISWKTLVGMQTFTLTSLSFLTVFINTLISLFRSRHRASPDARQSQPRLHIPLMNGAPHGAHQYEGPATIPSWTRNWKGNDHDEFDQTPNARRRRLESGVPVKVK
ncbi:Di-sulfide bridge nucleocytoplasmic transport domain-containing protein [Lentinula aciculospora]|uniref:Di-sulfide bridge nucleocytoplasmic transport domain-containing protein n=1 Tax=Lentinula aciculospora TaxID=153920 RepID=A0A9W9ANI5_9AGAR|nr:Di-sulfide bridge nucleocytoplasmic transport domain-containing protein [Lentinula aciculospora]